MIRYFVERKSGGNTAGLDMFHPRVVEVSISGVVQSLLISGDYMLH